MSSDESRSSVDLSSMKVAQLREELKKRNLSTAGNKPTLVQRLEESFKDEVQEANGDEGEKDQRDEAIADEEVQGDDESAEQATEEEQDVQEVEAKEERTEEEEAVKQVVPTDLTEDQEQKHANVTQEPEMSVSDETTDDKPVEEQLPEVVETGEVQTGVEEEEKADDAPEVELEQPQKAEEAKGEEEEEDKGGKDDDEEDEGEDQQLMEVDSYSANMHQQAESSKETTSEGGQASSSPSKKEDDSRSYSGQKRSRYDDRDRSRDRPDPTKVPDPEEPDSFDESTMTALLDEQFETADDDNVVTLDSFNSDLHFVIRPDGLGGCGLAEEGFDVLWAAVRATWGVKGGKYYYEVTVEENIAVQLPETEEHPHALRVGWSVGSAGLGLGEAHDSYGYGGTGKAVVNNRYNEYGETFGPGDVIGCYVDLESEPGTISFSKNGTDLGTAFVLEEGLREQALFPHFATKNIRFSVNFSQLTCGEPPEGYSPLQSASDEHKVRAPKGPASMDECEVLLMVGLPGAGKTTWAEKHCQQNPDKRYTILGTNLIMDKMKVSGLARKHNYHNRWEALIKKATNVLNKMLLLAGKIPRNYIIDQTNVYQSAQRRKMSYFEGFHRKAVVVIPPHHELRKRTAKRTDEMGKEVPEDAINAMKANFNIPKVGPTFEEVIYSEIYGPAAAKIVQQYREDALGLPSYPSSKRGRYERGGRYGPPRGPGGGGGYGYHSHYGRPYGGGYGSYGYSRPPYYPGPYGPPAPPPPPFPHHYYGPPRGGYRPRSYGYPPRGGGDWGYSRGYY